MEFIANSVVEVLLVKMRMINNKDNDEDEKKKIIMTRKQCDEWIREVDTF